MYICQHTLQCVYRSLGEQLPACVKKSSLKPFVAPEQAACNLI